MSEATPRGVPAHKCVPGTGFAVDGFKAARGNPAITEFFLTHAHGDHYDGMSERWDRPFHCSTITARVVCHKFGLDASLVRIIDPGRTSPVVVRGVEVWAVDANHCPGAVQFLFRMPATGARYIHSGDIRFCPATFCRDPILRAFARRTRTLYLDTTYCHPSHTFPRQEEAIRYVAESIARREGQTPDRGRALFLLSSYNIGKEKIFLAVARATGKRLYADPRKKAMLELLGLPELSAILTDDPASTNVHLVPWNALGELWPYFQPNFSALRDFRETYGVEEAVGFVPSGWTYGGGPAGIYGGGEKGGEEGSPGKFSVREKGPDQVHLVPYSEHSSYDELREYVKWIRPEKVVPTVGVGKEGATARMLKHFSNLVDEGACKRRFLQAFGGKSKGGTKTFTEELEVDEDIKRQKKKRGDSGSMPTWDVDHIEAKEESEEEIIVVDGGKQNLPSSQLEEDCNLLMGATGISNPLEAKKMLEKSNGNVEMAANMFFDSALSLGRTAAAFPSTSGTISPRKTPKKQDRTPRKLQGGVTKKKNDRKGLAQKRPAAAGQKSLNSYFSSISSAVPMSTSKSPSLPVNHHHHKEQQQQQEGQVIDLLGESDNDEVLTTTVAASAAAATNPTSKKAEDQAFDGVKPTEFVDKPAASNAEANQKSTMKTSPDAAPAAEDNKALSPKRRSQFLSQCSSGTVCRCEKEEQHYDPVSDAMWRDGTPCPYLHLASTFELITSTKKRLLIRRYLVNMFRSILSLSPESTVAAIYLTVGTLGPEHQKLELGIGGSAVQACVSEVAGVSRQALRDAYRREGDMGDVACLFRRAQRTLVPLPILTVAGVSGSLHEIHREGGGGSLDRKRSIAKTMIRSCRGPETRYIVRTLLQCMRIGANRTSVLQALARAVVYHHHQQQRQHEGEGSDEKIPPLTEERLQAAMQAFEKAYNLSPDIEELVPALISKGLEAVVNSCIIRPGTALKPMLAKPSTGINDAVKQMGQEAFICDFKYDGMRCQIHYFDNTTRLWSRNLEEKTRAFPDVVDLFCNALDRNNISSIVIDAEIVGIERSSDTSSSSYRFLSFQELSSRPRGDDAKTDSSAAVPVALFVFDIMLLNGQGLVDLPLCDRLSQLEAALPRRKKGMVEIAQRYMVPTMVNGTAEKEEKEEREAEDVDLDNDVDGNDHDTPQNRRAAATQKALMESLKAGCEGLMLKPLNHKYEPGKRSNGWIKLKKDYVKDMQESDLDLVPIGAWWGNGRKAGWYSPYLLAVYDPVREEYQSVCRVMSGFSDSFYKQSKAFFDQNSLIEGPNKPAYYNTGESCSVWFHPVRVWEIRGADISVSPVHRAASGNVHSGRGLALRFPRFIRERPDKTPEEATTSDQLLELFNRQAVKWTLPVTNNADRCGDDRGSGIDEEEDDDAKEEEVCD